MQHHFDENTQDWTATLRLAVESGDEIRVARMFSRLVWQDNESIAAQAQDFLEEFAPSYFAEEGFDTETLEHRLRMDLFGASMIPCLESKHAEIERSVEHDIDTWIEANTPAIVSAHIRFMEQELGEDSVETHQQVIKLHQLINLNLYEALEQRVLKEVWSNIETTLTDVMSAAAN